MCHLYVPMVLLEELDVVLQDGPRGEADAGHVRIIERLVVVGDNITPGV